MKILLTVSQHGIHTGSPFQLAQLAREFVRRGHNVTALFKRHENPLVPFDNTLVDLESSGVRVERFHLRKLKYRDTIPELLRLRKFLQAEQFEVIHCFQGTDFDFITLASVGVPIPAFVMTRGNGMPLDIWNSIKYRRGKVGAIVTVCEELKKIAVKSGGVKPEKINVIYGGVNLDRFDLSIDGVAARDELGIPRDVPVVGIIGSVDFQPGRAKGGYEFALAAKLVLAVLPQTRFLCVGTIRTDIFKPLGDQLGITDNFIFTGFRTDVPRMIAAMDVSVCASIRGEGLMGTLQESMAMAVPVVSTDVGGNKELVIDDKTGYVVPVKDPAAMAEKIVKILGDPEGRRRMGQTGRKITEEVCDYRKQADRVEALYLDLINRKSQHTTKSTN